MDSFIGRFATPLTTGLFAVSTISGVALFFHWLPGAFHGMHEWLSMLLLLPFALHLWKNWGALMGYARRRTLALPLAGCLVAALPFAIMGLTHSSGAGGNPAFRAIPLLTQARLGDLAPVLKMTPEALLAALRQKGYPAQSPDQTLDVLAAASGRRSPELLFSVMGSGGRPTN